MTSQRILFVSYHFPPSAAVGGQRVVNFAQGLSRLRWESHVLTIRDKDIQQIDAERLRSINGCRVHKTPVLPTVAGTWAAVMRRVRATPSGAHALQKPSGIDTARQRQNLAGRLRRWILSFLVLPDWERGWIAPATLGAIRTIRRHRIDWMMTSCPPYSAHLIGLAVKTALGTKWAADFRDPWMTTGSKRLYPTSTMSIRLESWLERKVVERADLVTFNVERLRDAYRARYAHVNPDKFVFIPNGISVPADAADSTSKYSTFTLSYTGSLYLGRSADPIFQALCRLIEDGRITHDSVRVKLIGQCRHMDGVPTSEIIRNYGLDSVVEVQDVVPHFQALDTIRRSHLALLFAPDLPFQIPAKAYDYLATGTRILAIAEDGGTADLIRDTGSGATFASGDVDGIARFIHGEMLSRRTSPSRYDGSLARFDIGTITGELARHLDRIAARGDTALAQ